MYHYFTYMFKDNKFYQKYLFYLLFLGINTFITLYTEPRLKIHNFSLEIIFLYLLGIIIQFILSGYFVSCVKAIINQRDNFVLPMLNLKNNIVLGFKYDLSLILFIALYSLLIFMLTVLFYIPSLLTSIFPEMFITCVKWLIYAGLCTVIIAGIVYIAIFILAFSYIFAKTNSITVFFQLKQAITLIKNNLKHYLCSLGIAAVFIVLTASLVELVAFLTAGNIITEFLSLILTSYTVFVCAYLVANIEKKSR